MDENVDSFDFDNIFQDKLPLPSPGLNKRYQMRQLSFKNGNESDSSLESVDLNISSDVSKKEIQKSESPKSLDENVNFNNSKVQYNSRALVAKGHSLDQNDYSSDENQDFTVGKYSLSQKPKRCQKRPKPQLSLEDFDKRFSLPSSSLSTAHPPTNSPSPASSATTSPSSSTSHQTFKLSPRSSHRNSVFDDLLFEIYNRWHFTSKESFDSDTFTDVTENDGAVGGREKNNTSIKLNRASLNIRTTEQLRELVSQLSSCSNKLSSRLVKHLRSREKQMTGLREKNDIMTAFLHASSHKTREDSRIRFSVEPMPGEDAFQQWKGAMRAVARLPGGLPTQFRKKVWLALADNYLGRLCIDWQKTRKFAFNERSNPDDSKLGLQIVKDLHRTGCSRFSGRENEQDRAVLKRVLLAYARWNKKVGYCQGFNILAALLLGVVDWQEDAALKLMIYVIDKVLPENYFANNLRSLSVDMAVFRDLLRCHLPRLSKHLDVLQTQASEPSPGNNYEPPLTNVFTMQWLLTMYATCLSPHTTLRLWDCILLEGSEVLLRTGVVIWEKLQARILAVNSASEFYCLMGLLSQQIMSDDVISDEELIQRIFTIAPYPLPQLSELREKFTYNITPFRASARGSVDRFVPRKSLTSSSLMTSSSGVEEDEWEDDDVMEGVNCFGGIFSMQNNMANKMKEDNDRVDISKLSPGAYTAHPDTTHPPSSGAPVLSERASLDLEMLRRQYKKVMQRQRKAHLILSAVQEKKMSNDQLLSQNTVFKAFHHPSMHAPPLHLSPPAINHLLTSRELLTTSRKNQTVLPITNFLQAKFGFRKTLALKHIDQQLQKMEQLGRHKRVSDEADDGKVGRAPEKHSSNASSTDTSDLSSNQSCRPQSSSSSSSASISLQHPHDDDGNDTDTTYEPSHPWCEALKYNHEDFDHVKFFRERGVFLEGGDGAEGGGGAGVVGDELPGEVVLAGEDTSLPQGMQASITDQVADPNHSDDLVKLPHNGEFLEGGQVIDKTHFIQSFINHSSRQLSTTPTDAGCHGDHAALEESMVVDEFRSINLNGDGCGDENITNKDDTNSGDEDNSDNTNNNINNTIIKNNNNNNTLNTSDIRTSSDANTTQKQGTSSLEGDNDLTNRDKATNNDNLNTNSFTKATANKTASSRPRKDRVITSINHPAFSNMVQRSVVGVSVNHPQHTDGGGGAVWGRVIKGKISDGGVVSGGLNRTSVAFNPFPRSVCAVRRTSQVGVQLGLYRSDGGAVADRRSSGGDAGRLKNTRSTVIAHNTNPFKDHNTAFKNSNGGSRKVVGSNSGGGKRIGGLDSSIKMSGDDGDYKKNIYNACLQRQYMATVVNHNYKPH